MRAFLFSLLFSCALSFSFAVEDDLGLEGEEGEIQFPSSILQARDGENCVYSILGIYPQKFDPSDLGTSFVFMLEWAGFTHTLKAEVDLKGRTLRIVTKKPIPGPILRKVINFEAKSAGVLPYWTELQSRDRPKAKDYSKRNFKLTKVDAKWPDGLAWFGVGEEPLQIPMDFALGRRGAVFVTRTTAYCMCHDRLSVRILDEHGAVFWETEEFAQGGVSFALTASGENAEVGIHDLAIDVNDHGFKKSRYRVVRLFEKQR